ncbi:MAG: sugar isomerase [Bacteroidetes bacterium MedPE-SWsnd-G2]|nr:MAG: sugar isomerase [Bacteroidetes bacterium MedPE-SWsnd-G2]
MGIVIKQSITNTITTYLGFGIGAINTLFLYTRFLSDEYYGLVAFILSAANVMMPLLACGVHNSLVKFYSKYKGTNSLNSFLTLMLFLPMLIIIPLTGVGVLANDCIGELISKENPIVKDYVWHIFIVSIAFAYFEVFYAWAKVHMKTVFGNFMKEVFHRIAVSFLLIILHYNWISADEFILYLIGVYVVRMIIMKLYAYSLRFPKISFDKIEDLNSILKYSFLIIIAGSIATVILDIDKVMLNQYVQIEEVAYYSVAVFIATVIAVPQRAMHQIMSPLTAQFLSSKKKADLKDLYTRSSINLFVVSGLIFLLILLNVSQLYLLIAPEYSSAIWVVFLISLAKLYDNLLGNNNAILFNSDYYRVVLYFGVLLTVFTVVLNAILIPKYGLNGSALATFLAIAIYNTIKLLFVHKKFKMQPFTGNTLKVALLIVFLFGCFYFWDFSFGPIINIVLKSALVSAVYVILVVKFNLSDDINSIVNKYLGKL